VTRIPAKEIERKRDEAIGPDLVFVLPANQTCDGKKVSAASPREPWDSRSAYGVPIRHDIYQLTTIPRLRSTCARKSDDEQVARTNIHARPTGGKNARPFSISMQQRSQSLRDL
jgi:hypothetical protein